mmetsp:Transcript_8781/g.22717  ORF Transcript_8781/g.22717 Transcript_8781/m.22717 type:complete len:213 (-) Transcript_8781:42-680(-)
MFDGASEEKMPCCTHSSAPSSTGTWSSWMVAPTPDARHISSRCPHSPKPVTSVHALAPCLSSTPAAAPFDVLMDAMAPVTQPPFARWRMCAAKRVPVPMGLVRTIFCVQRMPAFLSSVTELIARPVTVKPIPISLPSHVCPPPSAQPSASSAAHAPAIICARSPSATLSTDSGRVTTASATSGVAPIACTSESAWTAATRPSTYGSSMKERK